MVERIEGLHKIGYLHLDIKPDNILLGSDNMKSLESSAIHLIDYGISKPYLDGKNNHISFKRHVPFSGNVLFASKNCFKNYGKNYF